MRAEDALTLTVRGMSMAPLLIDGEKVVCKPARVYWPGDVVVFPVAKEMLVVHRFLGWFPTRAGWRMVCKGDSVGRFDGPVFQPLVIGRVIARGSEREKFAVLPMARVRAVATLLRYVLIRVGGKLARSR